MELVWDKITEEELKQLYYNEEMSDQQIADKFGVTKSKVSYRRKKFGINIKNTIYQDFISNNADLFRKLNSDSKERLSKRENIDTISKAIVRFSFRNGPVEDMHANNQLSDPDMKILNKYMVNRIAGLLTAIADDDWLKLELLTAFYENFGTDWDKPEPDLEEINLVLENMLKYKF